MNYTFSFDLSSTVCGFAIFYQHPETHRWIYHRSGYLKLNRKLSLIQRADQFRHLCLELNASMRHEFELSLNAAPVAVVIEQAKVGFQASSSAQVRALLQSINAMAQYIVHDLFEVHPVLVSEATARKGLIDRKSDEKQKHQAGRWVMDQWWYEEENIKHDKKGNIISECYDQTDAILTGLVWVNRQEQK